ncbi:hypothetical protein [Cohnella thailandensis]|uniref:Lipoprotein n=1 Tax=Cohnella thailandensis TaxID=557557 RepID=A0A841SRI3_9BACL|nr:hypothetical protein [Cohnella thailandensis]MBB6633216.1 hypothetical protein [Cohnella thailandensis]MBP1975087.1 hypothetical protein [Cohnella thailandensis]
MKLESLKNSWFVGLIAGMVVIGGCSIVEAGSPQTASYVLSEDVRTELGKMEAPLLDGKLLPIDEELSYEDILSIQNGRMLYNGNEGFYSAGLEDDEDRKPVKLLEEPVNDVALNGKKALYDSGTSAYILNIATGDSTEILDKSREPYKTLLSKDQMMLNRFADAEGRYAAFSTEVGVLYIVDSVEANVYEIRLEEVLDAQSYSYEHELQVADGALYMKIGVGSGAQSSLYKIELESLRSEKIIAEEEYSIWSFHTLSNGSVLFDGQHKNEDGVYIYDPATDKFTTLLSKPDADRGRYTYAFSLSPDENRILIHDVVDKDEISSAELKDGQLLNKITVMKGYPLPAVIWLLACWDPNESSFYVKLAYEGEASGKIGSIVKFKSIL